VTEDLGDRLEPALAREEYLGEAVWTRECDRIFGRTWCAVGREEDLAAAGAYLRIEVAGESILVTRDPSGALHAFFNVCRHRGAELVDSCGDSCGTFGNAIRCPYHAWTYALDGRLRRAPFLGAVSDTDAGAFALAAVSVDAWGGFVFVNLAPAPDTTLLEQLGEVPGRVTRYPLAEVRRGARVVYEVAANWKVLAENYNECYHCGPVHPELCELVPSFRRAGGDGLEWERGIPHREGAYTFTTTGTTSRAPFPDLDEDERVRHKGELAFPNLLLSLSCDHVASFVLTPRAPGHTTVEFDLLFHPDAIAATGFDASDAFDLWDLTNRQDWAICESVQRGMASRGFTQGWFAPMEDPSLDLSAWYQPRMRDDP
jgi:phenylpropionate dioxygenase-like ring-hydroxylating dioxygenase large terminal subunit